MLFVSISVYSQTTVKVMQYNLLNYGNYYNSCTATTNNIDDKNAYMKSIIAEIQPDILCVNELDNDDSMAEYLLVNSLNTEGRTYYRRVPANGNNYTMNMIYYDIRKFEFISDTDIYGDPRKINAYKMRFRGVGENAYITFISAHLKASEGSDSENRRAISTENVMSYVTNHGEDNYIMLGDFNVYKSDEEAYQNLINPSNSIYKFNDPVNQSGIWHDHSSFSNYHTQSTHYYSGCASSGGLDDRFDFILVSDYIKNNTNHFKYKDNSYTTVGQDGNHYGDAVNYGTNSSGIPNSVIENLFNMSDHLPVTIELEIDQVLSTFNNIDNKFLTVNNPVNQYLKLNFDKGLSSKKVSVKIHDISGRVVFHKENISKNENVYVGNLNSGIYLLSVKLKNKYIVKKIIKE